MVPTQQTTERPPKDQGMTWYSNKETRIGRMGIIRGTNRKKRQAPTPGNTKDRNYKPSLSIRLWAGRSWGFKGLMCQMQVSLGEEGHVHFKKRWVAHFSLQRATLETSCHEASIRSFVGLPCVMERILRRAGYHALARAGRTAAAYPKASAKIISLYT